MGHSYICLLFLPEFENSAEKTTHVFRNNFLEICHGGETHWVEGVQWVHMGGSRKSKKGILKHKKGHKSVETQQ